MMAQLMDRSASANYARLPPGAVCRCSLQPRAIRRHHMWTQTVQIHPQPFGSRSDAAATGFGAVQPADTVAVDTVVPPAPDLGGLQPRTSWNSTSLAFLGDSVWELYARRHCFMPPQRVTAYYDSVVAQVRAEQQEVYFGVLHAGDFLTDEERDVLRWGGNAKVTVPPRFSKSGSHAVTYKRATALECLVGWMYLTDSKRLDKMMCLLGLG